MIYITRNLCMSTVITSILKGDVNRDPLHVENTCTTSFPTKSLPLFIHKHLLVKTFCSYTNAIIYTSVRLPYAF